MRIGVVDIGSNTIRLLVAGVVRGELVPLDKQRVRLSLAEEIERTGLVSDVSIVAASRAVRKLCTTARRAGVESLDVFLTAPGRQSANAEAFVSSLTRAAGVQVRVLSTAEEARLAYAGAVATASTSLPETIAVCDVGGASTELAIGAPDRAPNWVESVDIGSVRLTTRASDLQEMCAEAAAAFAHVRPPRVDAGLCVGGSARASRRLVGPALGGGELGEALRLVQAKSPRAISRRFGIDRARARILPAGVLLLAEVQRLLGVPMQVCEGGIREGAVLASHARLAA